MLYHNLAFSCSNLTIRLHVNNEYTASLNQVCLQKGKLKILPVLVYILLFFSLGTICHIIHRNDYNANVIYIAFVLRAITEYLRQVNVNKIIKIISPGCRENLYCTACTNA